MSTDHPRVILTGPIRVQMLRAITQAFNREYPESVALASTHPLSIEHGATICLVRKDDPVLANNEGD